MTTVIPPRPPVTAHDGLDGDEFDDRPWTVKARSMRWARWRVRFRRWRRFLNHMLN